MYATIRSNQAEKKMSSRGEKGLAEGKEKGAEDFIPRLQNAYLTERCRDHVRRRRGQGKRVEKDITPISKPSRSRDKARFTRGKENKKNPRSIVSSNLAARSTRTRACRKKKFRRTTGDGAATKKRGGEESREKMMRRQRGKDCLREKR